MIDPTENKRMDEGNGADDSDATPRGADDVDGPTLELIRDFLVERDIESTLADGRVFVVQLPGEKRLKTACHLTVNRESVRIEAFVCRKPDEDFEKVYKYLLRRNRRLYQVAYTLDNNGDIYLVGRMPLVAVTEEELDRVLGQVLEAADHDFNILLETGFHTSIRREWEWRVSRGEPLRNLHAFRHLTEDLPQPGHG
ncbi:YbjN domain-containing protein [Dietzia natronolimnaea]|uniref:YbjN domain-containing protein n=1 Tax=Dietzia natronolimnaea TaxID=161920 RepID=UPI001FE866BA|nr:YbjN domain-containing protein [Dietzia natronolimnaea]